MSNTPLTAAEKKAKEITWEVPHQMYDAITAEFRKYMIKELAANTRKGDREGRADTDGWLGYDDKFWLSELYYHVGKLQHAVMSGNGDRIKENCADIANLAMMMFDNHAPLLPIPFDPSKYFPALSEDRGISIVHHGGTSLHVPKGFVGTIKVGKEGLSPAPATALSEEQIRELKVAVEEFLKSLDTFGSVNWVNAHNKANGLLAALTAHTASNGGEEEK